MGTKLMRIRNLGRCAVLAGILATTVSCGDVVRSSRSPVMMVVQTLGGGENGTSPFASDVLTNRRSPAPCTPINPCPTIVNDAGSASLAVIMKDVTVSPTTNNDVTITGYRVEYRRTDGRNTPGLDVPHSFSGAGTLTIPAGGSGTFPFELVRHE